MSLPIQLISTDFDGTLHTDFGTPPVPVVLQQLLGRLQKRGVRWVINTGRDKPSLLDALEKAQLEVQPDYLVVVEREIYQRTEDGYEAVAEWNDRCTLEQNTLFEQVRPDLPEIHAWIQERFSAHLYEDPFSPFCMIARSNADMDVTHDYLEAYCQRVPGLTVVRNDIYARFSHAAYNKGTALTEIARRLGIARDHILVAGDHLNDLPMLSTEVARWIVAPVNAVEAVKHAVRRQEGYISHQPCGEGVARGLEYVLEQSSIPLTSL